MYEAAASCKDIARAPVANWEPQCVTLARYCYAVRHGMEVHIVTPYRASHLQHYSVTVCGNVTSVYPPLDLLTEHDIRDYHVGKHLPNCTASHARGLWSYYQNGSIFCCISMTELTLLFQKLVICSDQIGNEIPKHIEKVPCRQT